MPLEQRRDRAARACTTGPSPGRLRARAAAGRRARRCARSGPSRAAPRRRARANASSSAKRKLPLQRDARVRRLAARVAARRTASTTARRNSSRRSSVTCGSPSRVARLARRDHRLRRAAGALGVGPVGIEPEPQRDADRLRRRRAGARRRCRRRRSSRPRLASGIRLRAEDLRERVRERVDGERLARARRPPRAASGRRAARASPGASASTMRSPSIAEPHDCELVTARRISDDLDHASQRSG